MNNIDVDVDDFAFAPAAIAASNNGTVLWPAPAWWPMNTRATDLNKIYRTLSS